jgi:hypothetical protein
MLLTVLSMMVAGAPLPATVVQNGADYTLANGYVQVVFTTTRLLSGKASLISLKGDFEGGGSYGEVSTTRAPRNPPYPLDVNFHFVRPTGCRWVVVVVFSSACTSVSVIAALTRPSPPLPPPRTCC